MIDVLIPALGGLLVILFPHWIARPSGNPTLDASRVRWMRMLGGGLLVVAALYYLIRAAAPPLR